LSVWFRTRDGSSHVDGAEVAGLRSVVRRAPSVGHVALVSDVVVLSVVALVWVPMSGRIVGVYAALAFLTLHVIAPRRGRLEAAWMPEAGWVLQRLALPLLVLVPLGGAAVAELAVPLAVAVVGVFAMRALSYPLLRYARSRGIAVDNCLVVGAGEVGTRLANVLGEHPEFGLAPVGFLDGTSSTDLPLPVLGGCSELDRVAVEHGVSTVLVADGDVSDEELASSVRSCRGSLDLYLVPRLSGAGAAPHGSERLWGVHLIHIDRAIGRRSARAAKRAFDVVIASGALLVLWPLMLAAAIATRVSSPGPILFRQQRVGLNGATFEMLKFRTMEECDDADTTWSVSGDHRLTSVGRLLRRTSVDELPQLINVLRGEMSIVGPRPERPHFVDWFGRTTPGYDDRHRVAGGLTGLAQIHGRARTLDAIPERARFDNDYIDHWSFWGDVVILGRTVRLLFSGDREPGEGIVEPGAPEGPTGGPDPIAEGVGP
jgi:exopolysaccharide biosynthesis polyprenyl glycosylphosphotransferase